MGKKNPRIDAYIARSAAFAKPILRYIRQVVHSACPKVEETIKWGMPAFDHAGPMCGMAAFKAHATFGFWKGKLIVDAKGADLDAAMGQFGCITAVSELPSKRVIAGYVKKAMALNEAGVRVKRVARPRPALKAPPAFTAALARNKKARATFEAFSPSCKHEYLEWILEAKRDETRERRIATAVAWMAEGKKRNWKYESC